MLDTRKDVFTFMQAGDQTEKGFGNQSNLYMRLITEELMFETLKGFEKNDIVEVADGIADSIWVIEGLIYTVLSEEEIREIWDEATELYTSEKTYIEERENIDDLVANICYTYGELRYSYVHYSVLDISAITNTLVDLLLIADNYKLPIQEIWDEVARSNLSKISPNGKVIKNEFGKIQKPETFSPADIKSILIKHGIISG